MDLDMAPDERAANVIRLAQAGVIGEPGQDPDNSPAIQELYFDSVSRSVDPGAINGHGPFTVQWRFSDAAPWHVVVDNGSTRAVAGDTQAADVVLESSWRDFIEIGKGSIAPPKALLQRRLKVRGNPRDLLRFRKLFA